MENWCRGRTRVLSPGAPSIPCHSHRQPAPCGPLALHPYPAQPLLCSTTSRASKIPGRKSLLGSLPPVTSFLSTKVSPLGVVLCTSHFPSAPAAFVPRAFSPSLSGVLCFLPSPSEQIRMICKQPARYYLHFPWHNCS